MQLWQHIAIESALAAPSALREIDAATFMFNPWQTMSPQINSAANEIDSLFSQIDASLLKGKAVSEAMKGRKFTAAMHKVIASSRLHGFLHTAQYSKAHMPADYGYTLTDAARKRAAKVNRLMRKTSKKTLTSNPESPYVLSKQRALASANFEASNSYFMGVQDAMKGKAAKKQWVTSSARPCDDCLDNEEAGWIAFSEPFESGDQAPLMHMNCRCALRVKL